MGLTPCKSSSYELTKNKKCHMPQTVFFFPLVKKLGSQIQERQEFNEQRPFEQKHPDYTRQVKYSLAVGSSHRASSLLLQVSTSIRSTITYSVKLLTGESMRCCLPFSCFCFVFPPPPQTPRLDPFSPAFTPSQHRQRGNEVSQRRSA